MSLDARPTSAGPADDALAAAARESLEESGFVRLAGLLDRPTVDEAARVVSEIASHPTGPRLPLPRRSVYDQAFIQEMNVWQRHDAIRPLVFSPRIARAAADLLGVDGVRLYHDQALVKEAGGGRTPWHCDQHYWPLATDRVVTAWIPLQDTPLEMGPLAFSVGSHRIDLGRELDISAESEHRIVRHPRWRTLPIDEQPMAAGDVSFHLGWTFHGAQPNVTDDERLALTMIYFANGTTLAQPSTKGQRLDRVRWLPDSAVDRPIDSWLNPVVWSRNLPHDDDVLARLPPTGPFVGTHRLRSEGDDT